MSINRSNNSGLTVFSPHGRFKQIVSLTVVFPILFAVHSLPSCTNLFNTICLFFMPYSQLQSGLCLQPYLPSPSLKPRGPTWSGESCLLSSLLWMLVSGDRSLSALPWHAARWLLSSDATISQPEQTRWKERGSERVRGREQRKGRGGGVECSATLHSDFPRSTCLAVSVWVYEAGWGWQREKMLVSMWCSTAMLLLWACVL